MASPPSTSTFTRALLSCMARRIVLLVGGRMSDLSAWVCRAPDHTERCCTENEEPPADLFEEWTKVMANTTMVAQLNACVKSIREFKHLRELRERLVRWKA
eukprot:493341-Pyramimonas_sp.AAC.2